MLHSLINDIYQVGTRRISLKVDSAVRPVALSEVMDGSDVRDYVERVEPSVQGGKKMAQRIFQEINPFL